MVEQKLKGDLSQVEVGCNHWDNLVTYIDVNRRKIEKSFDQEHLF